MAAAAVTVGGTSTGWTVSSVTGSGAGPYTVTLTYANSQLLASITGADPASPYQSIYYSLDLPALVGDTLAYVGFTGATGAAVTDITITDFTFANGRITSMATENKEQQRLTFGLTYRPIPNVAMTGAFEHNRRIQGSTMIFPQVTGLGGIPDKTFRSVLLGMSIGF